MRKIYLFFTMVLCLLNAPGKTQAQGISSIAGGDATSVVDALGTLYVNDAYKEADVYFFAHFSKLLYNYPELKTLFPATVVYLDNVPNYQYTAMLPALRAALFKDLKNMPWDITKIGLLDSSSCANADKARIGVCEDRVHHLDSLFNTEDGKIVVAGLMVADGAINSISAATVLKNIASYSTIKTSKDTVSNILRLLNVVSQSLLSKDGKTTWITPDSLKKMIAGNPNDATELGKYITALSDSMESDSVVIAGVDVWTTLRNITNKDTLLVYITNLVDAGINLDTTYEALKNDKVASDKPVNTAHFLQALDKLADVIINYQQITYELKLPPATKKAKLIFKSISSGLEISADVITKDYQSAVFTTVVLMDSLLETTPDLNKYGQVSISRKSKHKRVSIELNNKIEKNKKLIASVGTSDIAQYAFLKKYSDSISTIKKHRSEKEELLELLAHADSYFRLTKKLADNTLDEVEKKEVKDSLFSFRNTSDRLKKAFEKYSSITIDTAAYAYEIEAAMELEIEKNIEFKQNLLKFLGFAANVAAADSMQQVVAAIEAVALPPGSSIIKKTTHFSISLQGYAGATIGATGAQLGSNVFSNINSFSPYAPLGVSFNWDLKRQNTHNKKMKGSLSLYLSVIDIGGVVGYDFKNQNSKAVDTVSIKWQNVFAPGVNIIYGIPGIPLAVGTGFQYQPSLQWINNAESTNGVPGFRWQIFAAFDLPFTNLYTTKN